MFVPCYGDREKDWSRQGRGTGVRCSIGFALQFTLRTRLWTNKGALDNEAFSARSPSTPLRFAQDRLQRRSNLWFGQRLLCCARNDPLTLTTQTLQLGYARGDFLMFFQVLTRR